MKTLEASTGIEPVYTDLQSKAFPKENKAIRPNLYQDICRTKGEHDTSAFGSSGRFPTKNAVPGATVHGVHSKEKASRLSAEYTAKRGFNAMSKFAKPAHKAVARIVGYALTIGDADGWLDVAAILPARLTDAERAALAYAALRSLTPEQAELVAATLLGSAGDPLPAFLGGMSDARHWASWAAPRELGAYALSAFEAMKPERQRAFLRHVRGRMAA